MCVCDMAGDRMRLCVYACLRVFVCVMYAKMQASTGLNDS